MCSCALVSASTATDAWRAAYGCSVAGNLATTINGGSKWTKLTQPAPHILRVTMTSTMGGWVIGANADCTPTYYSTANGGQTWTTSASLSGIWVATSSGVHTPAGMTATPCGTTNELPLSLAVDSSSTAVVVCSTGIFRTVNSGKVWKPTGQVPSGRPVSAALNATGDGVLLMSKATGCAGIRVATTTTAGLHWKSGSCLSGLSAASYAALTSSGSGLISDGHAAYQTSDSGVTWS